MTARPYDRSSHNTETFLSESLEITSGWQEALLKRVVLDLRTHPLKSTSAFGPVHRFGLRQMIEALIKAPDQKEEIRTLLMAVSPVIYRHHPTQEEKLRIVRHLKHLLEKTEQKACSLSNRQLQTQ